MAIPETIDCTVAVDRNFPRQSQKRAEKTRLLIIEVVVSFLDESGYAETSMNAIQAKAGISRGSITHHFPTRQNMIVAATQHMLDNAVLGTRNYFQKMGQPGNQVSADEIVHRLWSNVVNTAHGRAFIEILMASRTNPGLQIQVSAKVQIWEEQIASIVNDTYTNKAEQMGEVWEFCRTYLRGLLIHIHLSDDKQEVDEKISRLAKVIARQVSLIEGKQIAKAI